jgi:transcriptional regulator with XRE-family HTH domain
MSGHAIIIRNARVQREETAMAQMSTSDLPRIGDVIRAWRIFRGLRSTELAARAEVRSQYLSEIEHNRTNNPKEDYLKKLADALRVPLNDILGRRMPPEKEGEDSETEDEEERASSQPTANIVRNAKPIPDALFGTSREEFYDLIASARLTDEGEERVFSVFVEMAKPILALIQTQFEEGKEC